MSFRHVIQVRDRSRAKGPARAVLYALAARADQHSGEAFPALATLADDAGLARSTVIAALPELVALGELDIRHGAHTADSKGGQQNVNLYRLTLEGSPPRGHPQTVKGSPPDGLKVVRHAVSKQEGEEATQSQTPEPDPEDPPEPTPPRPPLKPAFDNSRLREVRPDTDGLTFPRKRHTLKTRTPDPPDLAPGNLDHC